MKHSDEPAYTPPRGKVLAGLALACAAVCLEFVVVLVATLRAPSALTAQDYPNPVPQAMRWDITSAQVSDGFVSIEGWALVEGERFESVDIRPVLWDESSETGWALPTYLREDSAAQAAAGDVVFGEFGGFTGRCATGRIPSGQYEICIAYHCNEVCTLVHTGQMLEVRS